MLSWLASLFRSEQPTLGERGENAAARFLRSLGYKILVRNFDSPVGEIDIIARDGKVLVFVEVKTREHDDPTPEDQVNTFKQNQLTKTAKLYLNKYSDPPPARFDIVAIVWPTNGKPEIRHTIDAFEATF